MMATSGEGFEQLTQIEVLPATPEDALPIRQLIKDSWLNTFVNERTGITKDDVEELFKKGFTPAALADMAKALAEPREGVANFVAKDANTRALIGYCRVRKMPVENLLAGLHVAPHIKNRRVGTQLWEKGQGTLDPTKDTVLWVEVNNEDAKAVYRRWGFAETDPPELFEEEPMKSGAHRTMVKMIFKAKHAPTPDLDPSRAKLTTELDKPGASMRGVPDNGQERESRARAPKEATMPESVRRKILATVQVLADKHPDAGMLQTTLGAPLDGSVEEVVGQACYLLLNEIPKLYRDDGNPKEAGEALSKIVDRLCELGILSSDERAKIDRDSVGH